MILIINTSILKKGGGFQVALSFIKECIEFPNNTYHIFLSKEISRQIEKSEFPNNFHFYLIKNSPSSLIYSFLTICKLNKLERKIKPDCVFSVFGPSYWTPKSPHLLGYAQGYYLYPESIYFKRIKPYLKLKIDLLKKVHRFFFERNADYYYVESDDAKQRVSFFLKKPLDNIFAFSNTYNSIYNLPIIESSLLGPKKKNEIRLLSLTTYYQHKNIDIIKDLIPILKQKSEKKYLFILTIDHHNFELKFSKFKDCIINLGPLPINLCPIAYFESDFVFMPTLIEIFTASYPEAMKMKKPILTSDLPFAHSICGDAAEYFNPSSSEDITDKIIKLADNKNRQIELINKGEKRLLNFETPRSRTEKILEVCKKICVKTK